MTEGSARASGGTRKRLALLVVLGGVAAAGLGIAVKLRMKAGSSQRRVEPGAQAIAPERGPSLLARARSALQSGEPRATMGEAGGHPWLVFASLTRTGQSAVVTWALAKDPEEAVVRAAVELRGRTDEATRSEGALKVDVLESLSAGPSAVAKPGLDGVWIRDLDTWLLPEEVWSRQMVDAEGRLRGERLRSYLEKDGRGRAIQSASESALTRGYFTGRFRSFMESRGGDFQLYRGNELTWPITPESLMEAAKLSGDYLLRQQERGGAFVSGYQPWNDTQISDYNLIRQAGSCYALLVLYGATRDQRYLEASDRSLAWLLGHVRAPDLSSSPAGFEVVVPVQEGRADAARDVRARRPVAKLGANAMAVLALQKRMELTNDGHALPQLQRLGRFLVFQQERNGHFRSEYPASPAGDAAGAFDSVSYPGEAVLALVRLSRMDPDKRWLESAQRGARYLATMRGDARALQSLPTDHWLATALDELEARAPEAQFSKHAKDLGQSIAVSEVLSSIEPDLVGSFGAPPRSMPVSTKSEALAAVAGLLRRQGADVQGFEQSLRRMARALRRCQLTRESVAYLPRPDRALGGVRRGLVEWDVRIDQVQHAILAFIAIRDLLYPGPTQGHQETLARGRARARNARDAGTP